MTTTPDDLRNIRAYLMPRTGLPAVSLGVQHFQPDGGGYHEGEDLLNEGGSADDDYSVNESQRDRNGLTDDASALDVGDFDDGQGHTLEGLNAFMVARCQAGDPRARNIREIIYKSGPGTVSRWDALGVRSDGDLSHLTHGHYSFFRDSAGTRDRPDDFMGLLTEYFEGADMGIENDVHAWTQAWRVDADTKGLGKVAGGPTQGEPTFVPPMLRQIANDVAAIKAHVGGAPGGPPLDVAAVSSAIGAAVVADSRLRADEIDATVVAEIAAGVLNTALGL